VAAPGARAGAAFTPGRYYQPGLEVPNQSRLRGPGLKPGLYSQIGSPGWETETRGGLPTGTETHSCTSVSIVTTSMERCFSVLKIVKTDLRNILGMDV